MKLARLKHNLSIQDTSFLEMYSFKCGNTVPIYDIKSIYGLNQIIGHAKFTTKEYGEVLYRGETCLHEELIPSLFRGCRATTKWDKISSLINKLLKSSALANAINAGPDQKIGRHKVEGILQHYGIQTRFIDLVDNHWIALWMGLYECKRMKTINCYYHYQRRDIPIIDTFNGLTITPKDLFQYILLIALPKATKTIDGIEETQNFLKIDLRQALPSIFLRPHSQHGLVARKKIANAKHASDYDMATEVIGILRIRIDMSSKWLGNGELVSPENIFPSPLYDCGYDMLLNLPKDFFPQSYSISKYL